MHRASLSGLDGGAAGVGKVVHEPHHPSGELDAFAEALDLVPEAVLLLGSGAYIVHSNMLAEDLLGGSRGISRSADGHLSIAHADAASAIGKVLERCTAHFVGQGVPRPHMERIVVPCRGAPPLVVDIHPRRSGPAALPRRCVAIAIIDEPARRQGERIAALQQAFGFTPAEVRLVHALNDGLTLKEFAAQTGLSYETVRSYVRHVLVKAGARSQTDLVRLTRGLR